METPKFSQLRLLYPGYRHHDGKYTNDDVMQMVLGVRSSGSTGSLHGRAAAAVRLSWTLNRYGGRHAVGRDPVRLSGRGAGRDSFSGADGQQYIFRQEALARFLTARYGAPVVERMAAAGEGASVTARWLRRVRRRRWPIAGRQGIVRVVVRHHDAGGPEQDGFVGLWDCDRFHESRDWTLDAHVVAVEFWESAGATVTVTVLCIALHALPPSVYFRHCLCAGTVKSEL